MRKCASINLHAFATYSRFAMLVTSRLTHVSQQEQMTELTNSIRSVYQLSSTTLGYYFAAAGETLGFFSDPAGPFNGVGVGLNNLEASALRQIFQDIEEFTNLTFVERGSRFGTELVIVAEAKGGEGALANLPAEAPPYYAWFDVDNFNWDIGLNQGGLSYVYFMHEIGHVLGLEHSHEDDFGGEVLRGVSSSTDTGLYGLNQGIYTIMGYNDGWDQAAFTVSGFEEEEIGHEGTFSPVDIAVLQDYYGANTSTNTGNDTYDLDGTNDLGTHFAAIWDAGGTDMIRYLGNEDVTIDLRAATLDYTPTGGGSVSQVLGVKGGYTIANSVIIENAQGGSGDDWISGNTHNNELTGNAGVDILFGKSGSNTLSGGDGSNFLVGGFLDDVLIGGSGSDVILADDLAGVVFGEDRIIGGGGNDIMMGGPGRDTFVFAPNQGFNTIAGFEFDDVSQTGNLFGVTRLFQDFELGVDTIELDGFSSLNAGNVLSALSTNDAGVRFTRDGTTITIEGVTLEELTSAHFSFV